MVRRLSLQQYDSIKILAFGDSLTEGYTDFGTRFHPYATTLKPSLENLCPNLKDVIVDVEGVSGDCVLTSLGGDFADRLGAALSDAEYDLVILLGGTNDLGYKLEDGYAGAIEIFDDGLRPLYDYVLERPNTSLLVMTIPERRIDVSQHDERSSVARESREHLNTHILSWAEDQSERVFTMDFARLVPFPREEDEDEGVAEDAPVADKAEDKPAEANCWSLDGLHMTADGYDVVGRLLAEHIAKLLEPPGAE